MINVINRHKNNKLFELRIKKYYSFGYNIVLIDADFNEKVFHKTKMYNRIKDTYFDVE